MPGEVSCRMEVTHEKERVGQKDGIEFFFTIKLGLVWTSLGLRNDSSRREESQ